MDPQSQDHPLLLELNSLKSTVARFQDEAHASAVKLQRHSLDRTSAQERAVFLERENDWLKAEISILRANSTTSPSNSTVEQVQQLTLSLRLLSEKLTLTEDALSSKTIELAQANADLLKARHAVDNAYELGARVRGREEAAKIRENELHWQLRSAEEEKKISEVAVGEYANLVRSMETRMGLGSTSTLVSPHGTKAEGDPETPCSGDTLANIIVEEKTNLKRLLSEFHSDTEELQLQLGQLRGELEVERSNHEAERKGTHTLHLELGKAQVELHMLKIDDNTAAKMVSRYMQFSQTSTNALQSTLSALKTRHAATISTLTSTSYSLTSNLRSAENTIERLRTSLDEVGKEIMKETYGRRREVALRVKQLGREEKMLEGLRRWLRKGEEAVSDVEIEAEDNQSRVRAALLSMTQDARILLESLDDGLVTDSASLSGSLARIVLAQGLADGLVEELKKETAKRMDLEKILQEQDTSPPIMMLNDSDVDRRPSVLDEQESSPFPTFLPQTEIITVFPLESQPEGAPLYPPIPLDNASSNTSALDTPSLMTTDDPIPPDSADGTVIVTPNDHSPPSSYTHQSDNLIFDEVPPSVFPESTASAESLPLDVQVTLPASTPIPDTVIDTDVAQSLHICPEIPNSVLEEETNVTSRSNDLLVGPPVPVVVELAPQVEPAINESTSSALPHSLSDLQLPVLAEQAHGTPRPHPLLAELAKVSHRYDDFQRSFRDCHLALEGLKVSLGPSSSNTTTSLNHQFKRPAGAKPSELTIPPIIPIDILHAAVSRLDDYTEDVRVEIEIRISDEEVLAKGYEVLLCVPGALCSSPTPEPSLLSSPSLQADQHLRQLHHQHSQPSQLSQPPFSSQSYFDYGEDQAFNPASLPPSQSELEVQVRSFLSGTDPSVMKACEGFSKKLDDVQHDIAVLKRAIHDPGPEMMMGNGLGSSPQTPVTPEGGGRGWASWIRSTSGPPVPASAATPPAKHFGELGPSPTFGSIMTSRHRLNSPSFDMGKQRSSSDSATHVNGNGWMQGAGGGRRGAKDDVLGKLGLRVPMPNFNLGAHPPVTPLSSSSGWGLNGLSPTMPTPMKQRSVSSTMYMLGLGASPIMSAARSRGANNSTTELQKGDDPAAVDGKSVNEILSGELIGSVGRGDEFVNDRNETLTEGYEQGVDE